MTATLHLGRLQTPLPKCTTSQLHLHVELCAIP